ncbi:MULTISPECIES: CoA pyrophosphatase [unclassified Undibacterium]|uniref:CoA pyrophosphatase n=1 Tax=unclassified Undibacterium TaxID=2630295 RepID=UPI002AC9509B|nr:MULTISPECIES: CoA pyrophosphatase [unclassified Undibacterium]MEB0139798.1 CoA pyrophosphatase [Undibacterium sp. CCC2.1]MEB0170494.1 CoA pyrophosphatase [Undibacterium sp. CCC1.1]MEB0174435.1 CoA pyrophosphatase [Undibacterium sp. CCC3.4]MEB0213768.1 CoA pyrophosphatase [Undibacterium sp. 5I2]WPX43931.1 CoA pyrophosphatase [Undibacterium sp. CCC3.4]
MSILTFNPEMLAIASVAGEAALAPQRLAPEWLQQRFAAPPLWLPEAVVEERAAERGLHPASVLIPLVLRTAGLSVLLTQRSAHLNHHAGQISFPGGRFEERDIDPVETALRETEEEIGLHRRHIEVLGALPLHRTGTGYQVTPVVSLVHPPFDLQSDPAEVAAVFEVPLAYLMDGRHHQRRLFHLPDGGGERLFYAMPYQQHFIWGATAAMLRNLFHFLRA